ncbi:MAG TPA: enoyl-CoA hydratase/isomerase family protein [Pseudonocardia sp.]|jgi:enoyl-CoA hydratase/carnithine racemase
MTGADLVTMAVDRAAHIARITLRRPAERNALTSAMARAICGYLEQAERDDAVKAVVLDAEGSDLSAGWDVEDAWRMYLSEPGGATRKVPSQRARLTAIDELWWGPRGLYARLLRCRKVTILQARGACLETGLYLTLCSDLVVAADNARFGNPRWSLLGVDGDISLLIATVGLKRAKELMYCGAEWEARRALDYGLVDAVVPDAGLAAETDRLAHICASIMRDGIVTEKFAVFASLEKMGVGLSFAAATVVGGSLSNIHFQPGEFNMLREVRDRGVDGALTAAREWLRG